MIIPAIVNLSGDRWTPFITSIWITMDLTGAVMEAHIRLEKDMTGTPAADLDTVGTPATQGLRFVQVITATVAEHITAGRLEEVPEGLTEASSIPMSEIYMQVNEATMEAMPDSDELGDDKIMYWDLLITPSGGMKQRYLKGTFIVEAGATQ